MPSISSNTVAAKTEKVIPVLDLPEAFKAAASVVEKKCRNLEKRKVIYLVEYALMGMVS